MTPFKIYIVTYNNEPELTKTLRTLYDSDIIERDYKIYIINNHSNFTTDVSWCDNLTVLHNVLRPDFSTGHLSRNWNQALILGFESLSHPACDYVVCAQDDTIFHKEWASNIVGLHGQYSFITYGWGDNFMSWTPDGVRQIGLWDERFQFGGHTSEYFLRALMLNKKESSINDYHHHRILNAEKLQIADRPKIPKGHQVSRRSGKDRTLALLELKFPDAVARTNATITHWRSGFINEPPTTFALPSYIMYPYFEKDVLTLKRQRYI